LVPRLGSTTIPHFLSSVQASLTNMLSLQSLHTLPVSRLALCAAPQLERCVAAALFSTSSPSLHRVASEGTSLANKGLRFMSAEAREWHDR